MWGSFLFFSNSELVRQHLKRCIVTSTQLHLGSARATLPQSRGPSPYKTPPLTFLEISFSTAHRLQLCCPSAIFYLLLYSYSCHFLSELPLRPPGQYVDRQYDQRKRGPAFSSRQHPHHHEPLQRSHPRNSDFVRRHGKGARARLSVHPDEGHDTYEGGGWLYVWQL